MKPKTIIFFPIEIGLAHIVRSLGIAEELKKRGHKVIFALPKRKWFLLRNSVIKPVDISQCSNTERIGVVKIVKNVPLLHRLANDDIKLLEKYRPDCSVVDFRISAVAASLHKKIPTYCISGSSSLPFDCYLPDVFTRSPLSPVISSATRYIVLKAKEKFLINMLVNLIKKLGTNIGTKDLLHGIDYLVPENSSYLPLKNKLTNVHYVGHLTWNGFNHNKLNFKDVFSNSNKIVYISFGGTGFNKSKFTSITSSILNAGYNAIVTTGTIAEPSDFPSGRNLKVFKFLSAKDILPFVDAVVCHGGYGTMIEAALAGKPSIGIPFNPDQWLHSYRFQELGIGKCIINSPFRRLVKTISLDWEGFQEMAASISESQIINGLDTIFVNYQTYKKSLKHFKNENLNINGEVRAANIIESNW